MNINFTKAQLGIMIKQSEDLKRGFAGMVLIAPQILSEEDFHELSEDVLQLASNFDSCASFLGEFARMGVHSKSFAKVAGKK